MERDWYGTPSQLGDSCVYSFFRRRLRRVFQSASAQPAETANAERETSARHRVLREGGSRRDLRRQIKGTTAVKFLEIRYFLGKRESY